MAAMHSNHRETKEDVVPLILKTIGYRTTMIRVLEAYQMCDMLELFRRAPECPHVGKFDT
jgi:hypothetical protein